MTSKIKISDGKKTSTYESEFMIGMIRSLFPELTDSDLNKVKSALLSMTEYGITWLKGMVLKGEIETQRERVTLNNSVLATVERVAKSNNLTLCLSFEKGEIHRCSREDINRIAKEHLVVAEIGLSGIAETIINIRKGSSRIKKSNTAAFAEVTRGVATKENVTGETGFKVGSGNRELFHKKNGKIKVRKSKFLKKGSGSNRSTKPF